MASNGPNHKSFVLNIRMMKITTNKGVFDPIHSFRGIEKPQQITWKHQIERRHSLQLFTVRRIVYKTRRKQPINYEDRLLCLAPAHSLITKSQIQDRTYTWMVWSSSSLGDRLPIVPGDPGSRGVSGLGDRGGGASDA